ncbi:MAG: acyl-CoA dehydrogenase family protein [Candidatus Hydrogenedentes bacterium]|nr:acyl-CoA dehydrogenase family protein [Candidatus Hydrogenedentota bacterium]
MQVTDNVEKQKALDLAEESREKEWKHPSFVAELFRGNFQWEQVYPFPDQDPADKRIGDEYIEKVKAVLEEYVDPDEVDRTGEVPREAILALAEIGGFGMKIPKEYGGLGFSQTNYSRVVSFIGSYCASTAVWLSAHQSIGVPQPLKVFGTDEQRKKYLPRLAKGAVSAFALTEPGVGSDPARMITTATPSEDGSYYLLNGEKLWCTNGPVAEILVVMALTPSITVNGKEKKQITAFIVESDMPGFEVAHHCSFMGIRGIENGVLRFTNVKVPKENIIGKTGEGLKIALTTLNAGRLTIPATATAGGKGCMYLSKDWVNERIQWGVPIGKHQAVGIRLANMAANTFAMDSMTLMSCSFVDRGSKDIRLEAAMAKYYCTETCWSMMDDFVQVRGGKGYETVASLRARGEKPIPAERMLRDTRISRIIEGTSEIMQLFIAREAMDTHVSRVMPIMDPRTPFSKKWPLIRKAMGFYMKWLPKQYLPSSAAFNVRYLSAANQDHLAYVGKTSKKLARSLFFAMAKHKQKLEREQLVLRCYVDIGTDLFAMAASLSRAESLLAKNPSDKTLQDLVDLFCRNAKKRIADNFRRARRNHNWLVNRVRDAYMEGKYDWMTTDIYKELEAPSAKSAAPAEKETLEPVPTAKAGS